MKSGVLNAIVCIHGLQASSYKWRGCQQFSGKSWDCYAKF